MYVFILHNCTFKKNIFLFIFLYKYIYKIIFFSFLYYQGFRLSNNIINIIFKYVYVGLIDYKSIFFGNYKRKRSEVQILTR